MSLWDRVRSGASRATEAAGRATEAAQRQATAARLGMQIDDTRTEMRSKMAELGRLAHELVQQGDLTNAALQRVSQEINTLEAKVKEIEDQIVKVKSGGGAAEPAAGPAAGEPATE
jgi:chromosome segregation ATPase